MKISRCLSLAFISIVALPSIASACIVSYRPAEELKKEAAIVALATVFAKETSAPSLMGEWYSYKIKIQSVERGTVLSEATTITYYNLRAHERNGTLICPLKEGAGIETDLKIGQQYRFFLKSASDKEILFSELITSE